MVPCSGLPASVLCPYGLSVTDQGDVGLKNIRLNPHGAEIGHLNIGRPLP